MKKTIFQRIIDGDIPAHKVYEDDKVLAFLDIHPINPGHMLLVPKIRVDHLWDLGDEDYQYLWKITKQLATRLKTTLKPPRVGIIVEGFGVPHAHIHIIPLQCGDDIKKHQDTTAEPDHARLARVAEALSLPFGPSLA